MTGSPNPFVGPRPFASGERLWGREREIRTLDNLIAAERIVLLCSPSGAGKSSLIQAGLLPILTNVFEVWGPLRLNQPVAGAGENRYVASLIAGLEAELPEPLRRSPAELADQTLRDYAVRRPRRRQAPPTVLLVIDQFEEVLTVDPLAIAAKQAFFDQLGDLLHDPRFFALLALREDYLAALDPYAERVPSHLHNRFRIDLLGLDAACAAMVGPARAGGRDFVAAERLARTLALRKVQQPDGSFVEQVGRHVEPMQLQVVCRQLWRSLPADHRVITEADLERFGDVDSALSAYYADAVAKVAGGELATERAVRDWFGTALIDGDLRGQVLRRSERSEGLANALIERLLGTHLVRAEQRLGATWYELAHDRLIKVVQLDNQRWRAAHLSATQRRAELWQTQDRFPGLLLDGGELAAAESWAAQAPVLTEIEQDFLAASRRAREVAERERRQQRRIRGLAIAASLIALVALVAGLYAVQQKNRAEIRALAERARSLQRDQLDAALALALEVGRRGDVPESRRLLYEGLESSPRLERLLRGHRGDVRAVAWSRDGRLATADAAEVLLWDLTATDPTSRALPGAPTELWGLAWSPDGAILAAAAEGGVLLWQLAGTPAAPHRLRAVSSPAGKILALRFSPDGGWLAAARSDDAIEVWDVATGQRRGALLAGAGDQLRALAWSPDGATLAAASLDRKIHLWNVLTGEPAGPPLTGHHEGVMSVDWSPDGQLLASGSLDGTVIVWPRSPAGGGDNKPGCIYPQLGDVTAVAWRGSTRTLAIAGSSGRLAFWDIGKPGRWHPLGPTAEGQTASVLSIAWSPEGSRLASGHGGAVGWWRGEEGPRLGRRLELGLSEVASAAPSADGAALVVVGRDPWSGLETKRSWDAEGAELVAASPPPPLQAHEGKVIAQFFSRDGKVRVAVDRDGGLWRWDVDPESWRKQALQIMGRESFEGWR